MVVAQMPVCLHCERPAVFVSEPLRNRRNINAAFNASSCEQMPEIVMRDPLESQVHASAVDCFLCFGDCENVVAVGPFRITHSSRFGTHLRKQSFERRNDRHLTTFPILRAGDSITMNPHSP